MECVYIAVGWLVVAVSFYFEVVRSETYGDKLRHNGMVGESERSPRLISEDYSRWQKYTSVISHFEAGLGICSRRRVPVKYLTKDLRQHASLVESQL